MKCQDKNCCTCVCSAICDEWRKTKIELDKFEPVGSLRELPFDDEPPENINSPERFNL